MSLNLIELSASLDALNLPSTHSFSKITKVGEELVEYREHHPSLPGTVNSALVARKPSSANAYRILSIHTDENTGIRSAHVAYFNGRIRELPQRGSRVTDPVVAGGRAPDVGPVYN